MAKAKYEVKWISNQGGGETILTEDVIAEDESEAKETAYDDYYFLSFLSVEHLYDIEEETNANTNN